MSSFPVEPQLSKMLLTSIDSRFDCKEEMLTIAAMMSIGGDVFYRPRQREGESDR